MHTGPGPWHIHPHLMGDIGGEGHFGPLAGEAQPPEVVFTKGSGPRRPVPVEAPGALSCFPLSTFAFINTLQVLGRCSASLSPRSLRCVCVCSCQAPPHPGQAQKGPFATSLRGPVGESSLCHPGSSYSFFPVAAWHWPRDLASLMTASVPPPESPWNEADPQPHFPLGSLQPLHLECQDMSITLAVRPRTLS